MHGHHHINRRFPIIVFIPKKMANQAQPITYIFDRDFTAVQFQETTTPPTNTSNKTYLKGTLVSAVIKTGVGNDLRVVTADGYDITDGVSVAPEVVVQPIVNPPVVNTPAPTMMNQPIFSRNEKRVIGFVLLVLFIIIVVNESRK